MNRAVLRMTDSFLMAFLNNTMKMDKICLSVQNGLPPDTKIVRAGHDEQGVLRLVLESVDFPFTHNGDLYPLLLPPTFSRVDDAETA